MGDFDGTTTSKPEDDGEAAQEPAEVELRDTEQARVPDGHQGEGGEREGAEHTAVQSGSDQQVDEGPDTRESEPQTEAFEITLGGPTPYTDYPDIPERLSAYFTIHVLPRESDPSILHSSVDASIYDGDLVSDTIRELGVWEVPETMALLSAFEAAPQGTVFVDVGCHVGWFSLLALNRGLDVMAIDGDRRMLHALDSSRMENMYLGPEFTLVHRMVDSDWSLKTKAKNVIVKVDVEGAENHAIGGLWPLFEERKVSHLVMEISPIFEDYYPDLLKSLIDLGYMAYAMPAKSKRPPKVIDVRHWIQHYGQNLHLLTAGSRRQWIGQQKQFDVVLFHEGSAWG